MSQERFKAARELAMKEIQEITGARHVEWCHSQDRAQVDFHFNKRSGQRSALSVPYEALLAHPKDFVRRVLLQDAT